MNWEVNFYTGASRAAVEACRRLGAFPTFAHALPVALAGVERGEAFVEETCRALAVELDAEAPLGRGLVRDWRTLACGTLDLCLQHYVRHGEQPGEYAIRTVRCWRWLDGHGFELVHSEPAVPMSELLKGA
jgi:hypothetical protein